MTDFERKIMESAKNIDDLIQQVENTTIDLKIAIDDTDQGLDELQQEKNANNYPVVPGEKIQHLMNEMNEDEGNNIS